MAGESIMFSGPADKIPAGYLIEDGAEVGRVAYATLFAAIGTTYGAGDGATTFNLPDSRGEVWRGLDLSAGRDVGRVLGSKQGDAGRNLTGAVGGRSSSSVARLFGTPVPSGGQFGAFSLLDVGVSNQLLVSSTGNGDADDRTSAFSLDASRQWPTASEFRMRNIAKIPLIKY